MTPYAFGLYVEEQNLLFESEMTRDAVNAWNAAALNRSKRLPKLETILKNMKKKDVSKKQVRAIDGNDIFRQLDAYQANRAKLKGKGKKTK